MTELPEAEDAVSPLPGSIPSEMFPVLTSAQHARVLAHGQRRTVEKGEIVVELNEHVTKVFVAVSGQLHILQVSNNQERNGVNSVARLILSPVIPETHVVKSSSISHPSFRLTYWSATLPCHFESTDWHRRVPRLHPQRPSSPRQQRLEALYLRFS